jgi:hypothetical protein
MLLFCDTDCLIQLFLVKQVGLLRWLRTRYNLRSIVVPEVEHEVVWHRKFGDKYEMEFKKSVTAGAITVFNYSQPELHLSPMFAIPQAAAAAGSILRTGHDYALRVGKGEAYSHAACVHLGMPLLSHDKNAIDTLLACHLQTAAPVLRVFDLVSLAYRQNQLAEKQCDGIRQALSKEREFLPAVFKNASFVNGLRNYDQRLVETTDTPPPCQKFDDPLFLRRA